MVIRYLLILSLLFVFPFSNVFASEGLTIQDISNKYRGDQVTISGTTSFIEIVAKVYDPNNLIKYVKVIPVINGSYSDTFTLPSDATFGTYKVIAGQGENITTDTFLVREETAGGVTPPPSQNSTPISPIGDSTQNPKENENVGKPVKEETRTIPVFVGQEGSNKSGDLAVEVNINRTTFESGYKVDRVSMEKGKTDEAVTKAVQEKKDVVEVVVTDIPSDHADEVQVTIPKDSLKSISDQQLAVKISTEKASVQIPKETLSQQQSDLYFEIVEVKNEQTIQNTAQVIQLTTTDGQIYGNPIEIRTNYTGRTMIHLPIAKEKVPMDPEQLKQFIDSLSVMVEHSDGEKEVLQGEISYDANGFPVGLSIWVDKFSIFTLISGNLPCHFSDIQNHWAKESVCELAKRGIIAGMPDGTFLPDKPVTRAEFASMIAKAKQLEGQEGKSFIDIEGHWAKEFIQKAAANHIVNGYDNDRFGPNDKITREQMAAMIVRSAGLEEKEGKLFFKDNDKVSKWAQNAVQSAYQNGLIQGFPDQTFRPDANTTRAEAAVIIYKLLNKN